MESRFSPGNLVIVGAGFSFNAGLPLAGGFTKELLNLEHLRIDGPSARQVAYLQRFAERVFGEGLLRSADDWPDLEDIFTLVDLSANTGHHLGPDFSASDLRIVRRTIIVRMIRMLKQAYARRQAEPNENWNALETFFRDFRADISAVLSLNWDTVFEEGMERTRDIRNVDYGSQAQPAKYQGSKLANRRVGGETLHLLKPHGSINWLYCDACRESFWVPPSDIEKVAQTLFRTQDWSVLPKLNSEKPATIRSPECLHCNTRSLGTRFATFSYRKALDFPMHSASWRTAETYLKNSADWVFIGYSMPPADFEFKHLLKRVQLTEGERPDITVITGGKDGEDTITRFKKFFGDVPGKRFFFTEGLSAEALKHLRRIKVLNA